MPGPLNHIKHALEEFAEHHSDYQPPDEPDKMDSNESKDELQESTEKTPDTSTDAPNEIDLSQAMAKKPVGPSHPTIDNIASSHSKISGLLSKLKPIVAKRKGLELSLEKLDEEYNSVLKEIHDHTIKILNETNGS